MRQQELRRKKDLIDLKGVFIYEKEIHNETLSA